MKLINFLFGKRRLQHVFLKDKLISLDSVIPLTLEVYNRTNVRTVYYTRDHELINSLKDNVVLSDLVDKTGCIISIGRASSNNKVVSKFVALIVLIVLSLRFLFRKEKVIHFGFLNSGFFKFLTVINFKNIYLMQRSAYESKVAVNLAKKTGFSPKLQSLKKVNSVILLNDEYNNFNLLGVNNKFFFTCSREKGAWGKYLAETSKKYLDNEFSNHQISKGTRVVTYIMGHVGCPTRYDETSFDRNLAIYETLFELAKVSGQFPIAIKLHIHCSMDILQAIINQVNEKSEHELIYFFTKLHPLVLAERTVFSICNNTTTTFNEFHLKNVPTIEYGFHNQKMMIARASEPSHDFVTFFVNHKRDELTKVIQNAIALGSNLSHKVSVDNFSLDCDSEVLVSALIE